MRLLVDTHVLIWWLDDNPKLGAQIRDKIADASNDIFVSVASLWEMAIKVRIGKLRVDLSRVERDITALNFTRLSITPLHLEALTGLPTFHNDPFDHLLVAQSIVEDAVLVTGDAAMRLYPVQVIGAGT